MKGLKGVALALVAGGLCLVLLLTGAVPVCEAKPDGKVVKIGYICAWTGPLATTAAPVHRGCFDYIEYINEQGGIDGIEVQAVWEDYGSAAPRSIPIHKRMVQAGVVLEIHPEEGQAATVLPRMIRDEIPGIYVAGGTSPALITEPAWFVHSGPEFENIFSFITKWMREGWTEKRPMRLGYFHIDTPTVNVLMTNITPYLKEIGVEVVGEERALIFGVIDTTVEWLRLAAKKPDWVLITHAGATVAVMLKDAKRLGLQEKGIKFMSDIISLQEEQIRVVGKASEGWYKASYEPTPVTYPDCPMVKTVVNAARKYRGSDLEVGMMYVKGWIISAVACEAVRIAIEEVGFENLSGHAVRNALFKVKDFDTGLVAPITITEDRPHFPGSVYFARVEEGKFVRLTDFMEVHRLYHYVIRDGEVYLERI